MKIIILYAATGKGVMRLLPKQRKMKLCIPFPLSFDEFMNRNYYGKQISGFLLDNVEDMLQQLCLTVQIKAITITQQNND